MRSGPVAGLAGVVEGKRAGTVHDDELPPADGVARFELAEGEWRSVVGRLLNAVGDDERMPTGGLHLVVGGGHRRWAATDGSHLFVVHGADDDGHGSFLVPPRLLEAWPVLAADHGAVTLELPVSPDSDVESARLVGASGSTLAMDCALSSDLDVDGIIAAQRRFERIGCVVDAAELETAVRVVCRPPAGVLDDDDLVLPMIWFGCGPEKVTLSVLWGELGSTTFELHSTPRDPGPPGSVPPGSVAPGSESSPWTSLPVAPSSLRALVAALSEGEVRLSFPSDRAQGLLVEQDDLVGLLMPLDADGFVRDHVEGQLVQLFGDEVRYTDADGDYVLTTDGVPVYARLVPTDGFSWLVVFAQVLTDVEEAPDLLAELNQLNVATPLAKISVESGTVAVQGELVAETLDTAEVVTLYERVRRVAADLGPALAVRFGGRPAAPGEESRWSHYGRTVLHAELDAGEWSRLNGPDGLGSWPFDSPVFVITAANPAGRIRSDGENAAANARLAATLVRARAGFCRALGTSGDGTHREESFLVWGVTIETALDVAAEFGQDALFELTVDRMSVVGVTADRRVDMDRTVDRRVDMDRTVDRRVDMDRTVDRRVDMDRLDGVATDPAPGDGLGDSSG